MDQSTNNRNYKIALDAMGGDFAPLNEIKGAIRFFENNSADDIEIIFVGNENLIKKTINEQEFKKLNYSIVNADEVITMKDEPSLALKKKKNSSLYVGMELVAQGKAKAFLSAGNTGAMLAASTILLGRIKGVSRPTIGSFFPTHTNRPALLLDVGANIDSKPRYMYEFAVMGSIYANQMLGIENPKIGLLNIGEEESKGTEVVHQTYEMLKNSSLNFIGNVEGRDILFGTSDVVICDGFTGNIILKFAESVFTLIKAKSKAIAAESFLNKLLLLAAKPALKKIFKDFDYQKFGGVPVLGVNGVVIIGHGKSTPLAIENMINRSIEQIDRNLNLHIENALKSGI